MLTNRPLMVTLPVNPRCHLKREFANDITTSMRQVWRRRCQYERPSGLRGAGEFGADVSHLISTKHFAFLTAVAVWTHQAKPI
jgi:hypothetical protein